MLVVGTWIRSKEVGKTSLEIMLGFPSSFFLGMVVPLDLVYSNFFPSGTSFLTVKDFQWVFHV